jgi:hypothetical protein
VVVWLQAASVATQIGPFCASPTDRTEGIVPVQNGGSRATAATNDRHAARLVFRSATVLIADYRTYLMAEDSSPLSGTEYPVLVHRLQPIARAIMRQRSRGCARHVEPGSIIWMRDAAGMDAGGG